MPIVEPNRYGTEEILRLPDSGNYRFYVIGGFADFSYADAFENHRPYGSELQGDSNSDEYWDSFDLQLTVGQEYNNVLDVSPTAAVAGFSFRDSDETDSIGIELENCRWETVGVAGKPMLERIRLKIKLRMCGGFKSSVTKISYHLVAKVEVFSVTN